MVDWNLLLRRGYLIGYGQLLIQELFPYDLSVEQPLKQEKTFCVFSLATNL